MVSEWLKNVHAGRMSHIRSAMLGFWFREHAKDSENAFKRSHDGQIADIKKTKEELAATLQVFRDETRSSLCRMCLRLDADALPCQDMLSYYHIVQPLIT